MNLSSGVAHVLILGCFTCRLPRALHLLIHSSLYDTRTRTHNSTTRTTPRTLSQSTSCAIKNHSGVKTCRVAETRARQLPQVMSPKSLRLSQGSKIILEILSIIWCTGKFGEEDHRAPDHRRSEGIRRERTAGVPDSQISETSYFQSPDAFRRFRADSDLEDGELQKMLTSPLYAQKAWRKPMQWSCRRER